MKIRADLIISEKAKITKIWLCPPAFAVPSFDVLSWAYTLAIAILSLGVLSYATLRDRSFTLLRRDKSVTLKGVLVIFAFSLLRDGGKKRQKLLKRFYERILYVNIRPKKNPNSDLGNLICLKFDFLGIQNVDNLGGHGEIIKIRLITS